MARTREMTNQLVSKGMAQLSLLDKAQAYGIASVRTGAMAPVRTMHRAVAFANDVMESAIRNGTGLIDDISNDWQESQAKAIQSLNPEMCQKILVDMKTATQDEIAEFLSHLSGEAQDALEVAAAKFDVASMSDLNSAAKTAIREAFAETATDPSASKQLRNIASGAAAMYCKPKAKKKTKKAVARRA